MLHIYAGYAPVRRKLCSTPWVQPCRTGQEYRTGANRTDTTGVLWQPVLVAVAGSLELLLLMNHDAGAPPWRDDPNGSRVYHECHSTARVRPPGPERADKIRARRAYSSYLAACGCGLFCSGHFVAGGVPFWPFAGLLHVLPRPFCVWFRRLRRDGRTRRRSSGDRRSGPRPVNGMPPLPRPVKIRCRGRVHHSTSSPAPP